MLTFKIFFKWSTDISPLENLRLAYAARVDCNSYIMTPRNLDIPEIFINIKKRLVWHPEFRILNYERTFLYYLEKLRLRRQEFPCKAFVYTQDLFRSIHSKCLLAVQSFEKGLVLRPSKYRIRIAYIPNILNK